MHIPVETLPLEELTLRYDRCRKLLAQLKPDARGLMTFSRTSIYYFTGTMGFGVFWLPLEGEPLLMVRKGLERARLLEQAAVEVRQLEEEVEVLALRLAQGADGRHVHRQPADVGLVVDRAGFHAVAIT